MLPEIYPLPVHGKAERLELYRWVAGEEGYVEAKFPNEQRDGHDETLRNYDVNEFWVRQVVQYYDRANQYLSAAKEVGDAEVKTYLEKKAQQAICKAFMTAKGFAESTIRVYGTLPQPGVTSGEIRPWEYQDSAIRTSVPTLESPESADHGSTL